jgi:hypothetical protein
MRYEFSGKKAPRWYLVILSARYIVEDKDAGLIKDVRRDIPLHLLSTTDFTAYTELLCL